MRESLFFWADSALELLFMNKPIILELSSKHHEYFMTLIKNVFIVTEVQRTRPCYSPYVCPLICASLNIQLSVMAMSRDILGD